MTDEIKPTPPAPKPIPVPQAQVPKPPAPVPPEPKPTARGDQNLELPRTPAAEAQPFDLSAVTQGLKDVKDAVIAGTQPGEASEETLLEIPWTTIFVLLGLAAGAVLLYKFAPQIRDYVQTKVGQAQAAIEPEQPTEEIEEAVEE